MKDIYISIRSDKNSIVEKILIIIIVLLILSLWIVSFMNFGRLVHVKRKIKNFLKDNAIDTDGTRSSSTCDYKGIDGLSDRLKKCVLIPNKKKEDNLKRMKELNEQYNEAYDRIKPYFTASMVLFAVIFIFSIFISDGESDRKPDDISNRQAIIFFSFLPFLISLINYILMRTRKKQIKNFINNNTSEQTTPSA